MAPQHETIAPAWSVRLATDLLANDETGKKLLGRLTKDQLNWQPAPGFWTMGQCLEHLCIMNDVYLPPISAAFKDKPDSPVEQIIPGWFGGWFIRNFAEPTSGGRRVHAPLKIRPASNVEVSVLDRFLSGNQSCRDTIARAGSKDVNRIRFWNPFIPGLRFTVGTGLEIIVRHERRHLLQAERVRDAMNFPHYNTSHAAGGGEPLLIEKEPYETRTHSRLVPKLGQSAANRCPRDPTHHAGNFKITSQLLGRGRSASPGKSANLTLPGLGKGCLLARSCSRDIRIRGVSCSRLKSWS